ncbi:Probable low-specificity L-threonine aldolase 2 [Eumeta japonica]|uniref:Probable low-specificity L-threonine aldolase 2 n=1 Tax=Eumeta variegata TaxID=151549 RepID=A0A4C1VN69_EUMVA|nr:Probable low-specificity L-threonine aldolase 2 [Eumeta japonica]
MATTSQVVDLRSDTVTKPTESMKKAMITAAIGDDVYGEDPTTNVLQQKIAELLGKEAALFVPSGTMANLIAIMVHCNKRGAEMLCGDKSHIFKRESGGGSHLAGTLTTALKNLPDGTFDIKELENHVRGTDIHEPITMMLAVENTHNACGGRVIPLDWLDKVATICKKHGLLLHMDGSRLFNASEYLREEPARLVRDCDSVSVCFSKSLGAPVGSALAGTRRFIEQARRMRKMLGGGMRQSGVLAAAALVALEETVPSLYADHKRALYLAKAINDLKLSTFTINMESQQTNIVNVHIDPKCTVTSSKVVERLAVVTSLEITSGCKTDNNEDILSLLKASNAHSIQGWRWLSDGCLVAVWWLSGSSQAYMPLKNAINENVELT